MQLSCHRCGGDLPFQGEAASFCPHCGAPQLYLLDHLLEDFDTAPSTGAPPPPDSRKIDWPSALRAALFVALVAPALCLLGSYIGIFSLIAFLWILSGPVLAIGLYRKQRPTAFLNAAIGARIGIVVGLVMAATLGLTLAVSGLVARFALHSLGGFDAQITSTLRTMVDQVATRAAQTTPPTPMPDWLTGTIFSPEFRAAIVLTSFGMESAILLLVCTLGGAFAGSLRPAPRPTPQ